MEKAFLVQLRFAEIAESLVDSLKARGVSAELRKIPPDASYVGKIYNFTEIYVPVEQLKKAQQILKEMQQDD